MISSAVARGRVSLIDASAALALPGVLDVLTHENAPRLAHADESWQDEVSPPGSPFRPLQDAEIRFSAQPIALVVAETFELARYAAALVHVEYDRAPHETDLDALRRATHEPRPREGIPPPESARGDARAALQRAAYRHDAEYHAPVEHHNPMEPFAATVIRGDDGSLTVYDKTQGVQNVHGYLCNVFGLAPELSHDIVPLDIFTPCDMRAPGAAWGSFALECAMDELAIAAGIDPVELRLQNYADRDNIERKPFTSKELRECYRQAAARFGWPRRVRRPRSMRDGNQLIGWGMATGIWEAMQQSAAAKAVMTRDGRLAVSSATADIGTGTYTIMTQIAAASLGLPVERVTFRLGDSSLPHAPVEGGSLTAASVGTAVNAACDRLRVRLFRLARDLDGSPFAGAGLADITFTDGHIRSNTDPSRAIALSEVLRRADADAIEEVATTDPEPELANYARYTHSAVFAEVKVDPDFGTTRVTRVVSAIAGGRIINPKTARNQIVGGIVWGIGMALEEESVLDHAFGRFMTHNFADYHIPVNADVGEIDVIFVDERDDVINPLGVKGLGEPGLIGVAAAIANAVHHATGKRIRDLPITPDKLL